MVAAVEHKYVALEVEAQRHRDIEGSLQADGLGADRHHLLELERPFLERHGGGATAGADRNCDDAGEASGKASGHQTPHSYW